MAAKGDPRAADHLRNIELELNSQKAPISVDNFLKYVNSGFYNNTTFHRVIPGFMVQGGGFNEQMQQKQPNPPIKNEARQRPQHPRHHRHGAYRRSGQRHQPVLHQRCG
jgi:peptidyl-prolyl cis-trans isomerase A (cyclophilin A)